MSADGHDAQTAALRDGDEVVRMIRVAIDDRDAALAHKALEQAELRLRGTPRTSRGNPVIARDVGESRRRHIDPVETELVEPMARGFEREMIDAFVLQPRELSMQLDRIGRRVRELHVA